MLPTSISSSSSDAYEKQRFAGLKNLALERNYSSEQNSHSEQKPRSPLSFAEVSASLKLLFLSNDCARRAEAFTFRCHDGEHVSNNGKVMRNDCNICHTVIYDSARPMEKNARTGPFPAPG